MATSQALMGLVKQPIYLGFVHALISPSISQSHRVEKSGGGVGAGYIPAAHGGVRDLL